MENILKLKELRQKLNLSQAEFAAQIGMLQQQYSRYEKGEREPQIKHIRRICKQFNISADWLLGLDQPEEGEKNEFNRNNTNSIQE